MTLKVWSSRGKISVVNFYNPGLQLEGKKLEDIMSKIELAVVWFGDFNAHSTLWGSRSTDRF